MRITSATIQGIPVGSRLWHLTRDAGTVRVVRAEVAVSCHGVRFPQITEERDGRTFRRGCLASWCYLTREEAESALSNA